MGRMIITAKQLKTLKENLSSTLVDEGVWDNFKYSLSKLGQDKNQQTRTRDTQQIKDIINKTGNEIIKKLDDEITKKNPEFPNNPNSIDFLQTVISIASVYDSLLVAATKKSNVYGFIPVEIANGIISDLREYVKSIITHDLNRTYSVVDEVEPKSLVELSSGGIRKHLQTKGGDVGLQDVLEPIAVPVVQNGSAFNLIKSKGAKQSRAKTLNDLYISMRNINGGLDFFKTNNVPPSPEPNVDKEPEIPPVTPDVARGTTPITNSVSTDDVYNSLRALFKFIVASRKTLGIRSAYDTQNGANNTFFQKMKTGDKVFYNRKPVTILNTDTGVPNKTLVQYQNGTKMAVDSDKLHKLQESVIFENRYIKSKQVLKAISKGISDEKLKSFDEFMNRLEQVRNKIKNLKPTGDKVLDGWVNKIKTNPIIATNFQKMFDIAPDNPNVVNTLMTFINKLFSTVYGGRFKNGQLMDKIASVKEAVDMDPTAFARVAQDRSKFNQNIMTFLSDCIGFYQYLAKLKK